MDIPSIRNAYDHCIKIIVEQYGKIDDKPFLKHLEIFANNDSVSKESIKHGLNALAGHSMQNNIKAGIVMDGANVSLEMKCPHKKYKYQDNIPINNAMSALTHSRDSGVIQSDGSINEDKLLRLLENCKYNHQYQTYILWEKDLLNFMKIRAHEDKDLPSSFPFQWSPTLLNLVSFETIAAGEWADMYDVYTNVKTKKGQRGLTLRILLLFYYKPEILNNEKINNKLTIHLI